MFELMQAEAAMYAFRQQSSENATVANTRHTSTSQNNPFDVMVNKTFMTIPPVDRNAIKALAKHFSNDETSEGDCLPSLRSCPVPSRQSLLSQANGKGRAAVESSPPSIRNISSRHSTVLFDKRCEEIVTEGRQTSLTESKQIPSWVEATLIPMRVAGSSNASEEKGVWIEAVHDHAENEKHRLATPVQVLGARRKVLQPTPIEVSCTPQWVIHDTQPPRNAIATDSMQRFTDQSAKTYKHIIDGLSSDFEDITVRKELADTSRVLLPQQEDRSLDSDVASTRRTAFMQSLCAVGASTLPPDSMPILPSTLTMISSTIPELHTPLDSQGQQSVTERREIRTNHEAVPQHSPFMRRTAGRSDYL